MYNSLQGNNGPGSDFLCGAMSECPKIFVAGISYLSAKYLTKTATSFIWKSLYGTNVPLASPPFTISIPIEVSFKLFLPFQSLTPACQALLFSSTNE